MSAFFGAGAESDAYFAAFTIPQQLSDFFIGGILFVAIIPIFQKRRAEAGDELASEDMAALLNIALIILSLLAFIFYLLVPYMTPLIFSGFSGEKLEMTIKYSRLFAPGIVLMGLSLIYISFFHSFREFVIPSIAALAFPLSSLFSIWCLPERWGIERLVYGNLAGSAAGLALMIFIINKRVGWKWNWKLNNPVIISAFSLSWPVLLENLSVKIIPLIQKNIASGLPLKGAITLIELSMFVVSSISIIIAGPISTAVFPFMGQQRVEESDHAVFQTFFKSVKVIFFLAIPLNIILFAEADSIVGLLFGYGKFSDTDCAVTANLIMIVSFIVVPTCFISIAGRIFFIFHDTKLISFAGMILVFLSWPLYYIAAGYWGIYGLMAVFTAMTIISTITVIIILRLRHKTVSFSDFYLFSVKIFLCALLMAAIVLLLKHVLVNIDLPLLAKLSATSILGFSVYLAVCHLLKIDELNFLIKRIPFSSSKN
jgi:putative peptidoglycan lipid II flippase